MRYTEILALAMGNVAAAQFATTRFANTTTSDMTTEVGTDTSVTIGSDTVVTSGTDTFTLSNTETETETETGTATTGTDMTTTTGTETATATATGDLNGFNFLGCYSSDNGFPGFSQVYSSEDNDPQECTAACVGSNFAGLYDNSCYCGNELDASAAPAGSCDIVCPGDDNEICGGLDDSTRMMRRQVAVNVLLSIYIAADVDIGGETNTVSVTDFVTETLPPITTTATRTVTDDGVTTTATVTTVLPAVPTNIIIICYGNYCAPQIHCPTCSKWQIVCDNGLCAPRECPDDEEYWYKLKICVSGSCHYANYQGEECNQRIVCHGSECQRDQHYAVDYQRKFICEKKSERYYFEECRDDCYSYNECHGSNCTVVAPPTHPVPCPPPKPVHPNSPPVVVPEHPQKPGKPVHPTPEHPQKPGKPVHPTPEHPQKPGKP
ncbi:hypothetical protein FSARC_3872, partial [Fusarium sarcochroum]